MTFPASKGSFPRCLELVAAVVAAGALLVARPAQACGAYDSIEQETTFDPSITGEPEELFYDPYRLKFGDACEDCFAREMRADWAGYLGPEVSPDDWQQVLLKASLADIDGLIFTLQGKQKSPPAAYAKSSVVAVSAETREKVVSALFYVGFARRVEPWSNRSSGWSEDEVPKPKLPDPKPLLSGGSAAFARAKAPFLRQRYAYQLLRLFFYAEDYAGAVKFFDAHAPEIDAPSASLRWRAHHYVAGALLRSGQTARGNLELARVHASFPPLASAAANDFAPKEDKDWREALNLAKAPAEKVQLWRLVGLQNDAVAAIREMTALDPSSPLTALLAARELNRLESDDTGDGGHVSYDELEKACLQLASAPKADRPWFFALVAAHAAAMRGDVAAVRSRIESVRKAKVADPRVEAQAKATLALALAHRYSKDKSVGDEMATLLGGLGENMRLGTAGERVRQLVAQSGDPVLRALLADLHRDRPWTPETVRTLIAWVQRAKTPFEAWVVRTSGVTLEELVQELAASLVARGKYAEALAALDGAVPGRKVGDEKMGTDPFVMHIRDCHDCDHETYANGPWTYRAFVAKLDELARVSRGSDEKAAQASFELGSALYNLSPSGNARDWAGEHSKMEDLAPAEAAYAHAIEASHDRERKAKAAYMGAKCELERRARTETRRDWDALPVPEKWFPVLATFSDTAYHQQVLRECGHYTRWYHRND